MSKDYENTHYQPTITNNKAWEKIKKLDFDIPEGWLEKGERDSFDRIKLLAKDIKDKGTVFDIGCNIGFFAHVLQFLGNKVTGIDNDVHVDVKQFTQKSSIDTARDLNKKYGSDVEFIEDDFIKFLEGTKRSWDYVLFLSVFHHLFIGYGYSDFNRLSSVEAVKTLQLIDKHTDKALYFEMDEKVGHPYGWGSTEEVVANIKMFTSFDVVEVLDVSKDAWAEGRTLIRCSRSGKRTAPPKVIGLSSLSRRNAVGVVKGDSLFVSREANDWSAEEHPYGVDIKRVKVLKDGTVLERLKKIKHKNICEVRGYDDKWVELEYVEGELLSSAAPYLPEQRDYLSRGVGVTEAVSITEKLYDALLHLHEAGIAHTDLISFNVMMTASGEPKIIDMIGCMPLTERLKQLDLEVFWKRCAMEIFDRVAYEFLDEKSDEKLAALAWGSSKRMMSLSAKVQEIEELLTSKDAKMQELETINKSLVD
ncbi:hypothetical protein KC959_04075, partial [Candidatus Saccharibacteria bacterium]|nr:hypothetical protein [Candidatus Saccharibacteria bacterium]